MSAVLISYLIHRFRPVKIQTLESTAIKLYRRQLVASVSTLMPYLANLSACWRSVSAIGGFSFTFVPFLRTCLFSVVVTRTAQTERLIGTKSHVGVTVPPNGHLNPKYEFSRLSVQNLKSQLILNQWIDRRKILRKKFIGWLAVSRNSHKWGISKSDMVMQKI